MAYDDSEALQPNSTYNLGGYSFELKVQTVHEPGEEDVVSVFAICRSPDGTRETVPMDFPAGTTVESWTVEANETEATVYVKTHGPDPLDTGRFTQPIPNSGATVTSGSDWTYIITEGAVYRDSNTWGGYIFASSTPEASTEYRRLYKGQEQTPTVVKVRSQYTYAGKTVYYYSTDTQFVSHAPSGGVISGGYGNDILEGSNRPAQAAWMMVYGEIYTGEDEILVARFTIDLREADGGPDGDWDEPGDVGPGPEKYFTLTVSVTGASSGSNSGTPLEPGQAGGYGDGGTGGNGGGGGAGASTVIIWDFATSKADNVVQEAAAQGPGTGGPGGKGGKGWDGCILIFY